MAKKHLFIINVTDKDGGHSSLVIDHSDKVDKLVTDMEERAKEHSAEGTITVLDCGEIDYKVVEYKKVKVGEVK